jgi:MFS family permease
MSLSPSRLAVLRQRTIWTLVAGVAIGSTGHIAAVTVGTIVAEQIAGTAALAGLPAASVVLGSAIGSALLSLLMARRGRRAGLSLGYTISVGGAIVAAAAVVTVSLPLLVLGTLMIGFGNSSNQLSRYAAADLVPLGRRASTIGLVVWGATVGAVVGPNLVAFSGEVAINLGLIRSSLPTTRRTDRRTRTSRRRAWQTCSADPLFSRRSWRSSPARW